jgi:hypothetical protein
MDYKLSINTSQNLIWQFQNNGEFMSLGRFGNFLRTKKDNKVIIEKETLKTVMLVNFFTHPLIP